jgi:hypothetical protein
MVQKEVDVWSGAGKTGIENGRNYETAGESVQTECA